jgi:hypothetical protein
MFVWVVFGLVIGGNGSQTLTASLKASPVTLKASLASL